MYQGEMNETSIIPSPQEEVARLAKLNEELTRRIQTLEQLVGKDELTGLDNRRRFNEELHRVIAGAFRSRQPVSLIFADIDHFKTINDRAGHLAGDSVLVKLARILKHGLRETDRACRYGGEELALILPDTILNNAIGVSERLRRKVETSSFEFSDPAIKVTTSMGVCSFIPPSTDTQSEPEEISKIMNQLISHADEAMYAAKKAGRNRTGFRDSDNRVRVLETDPNNLARMVAVYPD